MTKQFFLHSFHVIINKYSLTVSNLFIITISTRVLTFKGKSLKAHNFLRSPKYTSTIWLFLVYFNFIIPVSNKTIYLLVFISLLIKHFDTIYN